MKIRGTEQGWSNPDRGADLAWKVVARVVPTLQMIAAHENIEISIEVNAGKTRRRQ